MHKLTAINNQATDCGENSPQCQGCAGCPSIPATLEEATVQHEKQKVRPEIPKVFTGGYPQGYRPWVGAWSVQEEDLRETLPDGTFTLTQLDISINPDHYTEAVNKGFPTDRELNEEECAEIFGRAKNLYGRTCGIACKGCFECDGEVRNLLMSTEEVFHMLKEAKELGVKHVKFLGPGELMHNPRLFEILDFLQENGIKIGIFTKGVVLGDDEKAQQLFGREGISTAKEFCAKIASYENVTILLGLVSADRKTEQGRIDSQNFPNLFEIRNQAFENLAEAGLNKDPNQQRLAIVCAPVLRDNIDEVVEIYKYGLERNIPVLVAPTMLSGKGANMKEITDPEFKEKDLVELYIEIYSMLIKEQIFTLEQVEQEGISPYAGYACNQFIGGMLIRKDGQVMACPGNDKGEYVYHRDVRKKSLKEIWKGSIGYRLRERFVREAKEKEALGLDGRIPLTQPCYAKTEGTTLPCENGEERTCVQKGCGSIPEGFYEKVMEGIRERVKNV